MWVWERERESAGGIVNERVRESESVWVGEGESALEWGRDSECVKVGKCVCMCVCVWARVRDNDYECIREMESECMREVCVFVCVARMCVWMCMRWQRLRVRK